MTWNGAQGFQTPIENETFHVKDFGVYDNMHQERDLTCTLPCSTQFTKPIDYFPDRCGVLL